MNNYSSDDKKNTGHSAEQINPAQGESRHRSHAIQTWQEKIPASIRYSLVCWVIFRFVLTFWGWLIWKLGWASPTISEIYFFGVDPLNLGWKAAWLGIWIRWDAIHYLRIAEQGFVSDDLSAFFPLFPLLGRAVSQLLGVETVVGLMLVSNLCLVLAATLLFEIAAENYGLEVAQQTVISLYIYPLAIFLFAPYTESLALFLILSTYLATHRRKWIVAIPAGIAAGLSRGTVLPLISLLLLEMWSNRKSFSRTEWIAGYLTAGAPAVGIGLFLAWRTFMSFPDYERLLITYWGRQTVWPWEPLLAIPSFIHQGVYTPVGYFNLLMLVLVIGISIWVAPRLPICFTFYQLLALIFTLSTTLMDEPLGSWGRYSLILFPTYLGLGLWSNTHRRRLWAHSFLLLLMLLVASQYFMYVWVE